MSRGCSSYYQCMPGWSQWPYIDNYIYDNSEDSDSLDSSEESDGFEGSNDSDDDSTYWSYQPPSYSYYAVHTSCPATSCLPPTGILDHFTQFNGLLPENITTTRPVYYYYYYIRLMAFFQDNLGKPAPEKQNHSGETNLDLLEQEIVSGSGISWMICKSAPCSRQIIMPNTLPLSFCRPDALPAAQPTASMH